MAKRMLSVCDVCGGPTDLDTYRFGWDLKNYEVDLCDDHAEPLIEIMESLVKVSRKLGAGPRSVVVDPPPPRPRDQVSTAEVRAWAKKHKIEVSERGRIPDEIFEQYVASKKPKK